MTKPCAIDGCERRAIKRGWCEMHYVRWWTHGDPLTLLRPQKHLEPCSIEGCGRPSHARGWCQHHWRRWYRHGDPLVSRTRRYSATELERLNAYIEDGKRTKLGDIDLMAMSLGRSNAAITTKLYELRRAHAPA